jgi:hypothetical protein
MEPARSPEGKHGLDVTVVIPAYNEQQILPGTVAAWREVFDDLALKGDIWIVDDGSTDDSLSVLPRADEWLHVLSLPHRGHGHAVTAGYRAAISSCPAPKWVMQADADREVPVSEFHSLWDRRLGANLVLGRRIGHRRPARRLISRTAALLLRILWSDHGTTVVDPNIPFRLIDSRWLASALERFPASPQCPNLLLVALARDSDATIVEVPVPFTARECGRTALPQLLTTGVRSGWQLLVIRLSMLASRRVLHSRKRAGTGRT